MSCSGDKDKSPGKQDVAEQVPIPDDIEQPAPTPTAVPWRGFPIGNRFPEFHGKVTSGVQPSGKADEWSDVWHPRAIAEEIAPVLAAVADEFGRRDLQTGWYQELLQLRPLVAFHLAAPDFGEPKRSFMIYDFDKQQAVFDCGFLTTALNANVDDLRFKDAKLEAGVRIGFAKKQYLRTLRNESSGAQTLTLNDPSDWGYGWKTDKEKGKNQGNTARLKVTVPMPEDRAQALKGEKLVCSGLLKLGPKLQDYDGFLYVDSELVAVRISTRNDDVEEIDVVYDSLAESLRQ